MLGEGVHPVGEATCGRPRSSGCAWTGICAARGTRRDSALVGEERYCEKATRARGADDKSSRYTFHNAHLYHYHTYHDLYTLDLSSTLGNEKADDL